MIKITLPNPTKSTIDIKKISRICPKCNSKAHIHARFVRHISDPKIEYVEQLRMKCTSCNHTWYIYADGVRRYSGRTSHMVFLGILLYSFGLSFDKVSLLLYAITLRKQAVKSTLWNDFQRSGKYFKFNNIFTSGRSAPEVVCEDGTYVKIKGEKACITFINDGRDGLTIAIDLVDERNEQEVVDMFYTLAKHLNLNNLHAIVTDGNTTINNVVDTLNGVYEYCNKLSHHRIKHALCGAHVKKNIRKRLNKYLNGLANPPPIHIQKIIKRLNFILAENFPTTELGWLRQAHIDYKYEKNLGNLLRDMYINYNKYCTYQHSEDIPFTNNISERNFIEVKQRYKLTRGFKSREGCLNYFRNFIAITQDKISQDYFNFI